MRSLAPLFLALAAGGCVTFKPFVPAPASAGATPLEQRLQRIVDDAVNEFGLPGVQAGVSLPDGRVVVVASGTRDPARGEARVGTGDAFKVGSPTKMLVAALFGRLQEQGVLSFDDRLSRWVPEVPGASDITLRQLLGHRSGIPESLFSRPGLMLRAFFSDHLLFEPLDVIERTTTKDGAEARHAGMFQYANNNYVILGLVAQRATGVPVRQLLREQFFAPMGMRNTWLLPDDSAIPGNLIQGYDEFIPLGPHTIERDNTTWDSLTFTAGAMASTAGDLLTFLDALFRGRALRPETLAELQQFADSRHNGRDENMVAYGLGLAHYDLDGAALLGHPGGGFGGECFPFFEPAREVSVVVLYNLSRKDNPAGKQLLRRILGALDPPPGG
jgi:D-alanyl-D-alanine carboxypeptidase